MSFLSDISKGIADAGFTLQETVVVLPNERARRMLLEQLSQNLQLPAFVPAIYSIEHFIDLLSPLQTIDKLELLAALYGTVRGMEPPVAESFDEMLTWAPAFLSDIDEIDMQLQEGEYVFKTLAFDKEFTIEMADGDQKESMMEKMAFYARLAELYVLFGNQLKERKQAYNGLKFRDCAENIEVYARKLNFKHFVFAGFHVFTPSELSVVRYIKNHFDARFFFDVDPFYCDFNQDDRFTTAFFLRKICAGLDIPQEGVQYVYHDYEENPKRVQIVGAAKEMNQIFYAIEQLKRIEGKQGSLDGTALVLADEKLLVPFLSAYGMDDVNVTMGYPLTATPGYTLLSSLLDMYQTALRYSHGGVMRFHHKDVVAVLRNSVVRKCLFTDEKQYEEEVASIEDNQRALYTYADLPDGYIPTFSADTGDLLPALIQYFERLLLSAEPDGQETALLNMVTDALKKTEASLQRLASLGQSMKLSTIKYAIGLQLDNISLAIKGNPLKGLQVMGLLETRTLDFKHVIMLSVNEGVLPAGISYNTLLPFEIKYDNHSLPNYLYKDQVYAYHFFRLLQRAEDVVLIYNNVSDTSLMEKSRFITQLEFLKQEKQLNNIQLEYPQVGFQFKASIPEEIMVEKTEETMRKLYTMSYSATALSRYVNCPLQFYFRDICGIEPRQTFQERIESNIIGTVVHALLEDVFNEIKENPSEHHAIIQRFMDDLEERIHDKMLHDEKMGLHLRPEDLSRGRIYLATRMVFNDVYNYLQKAVRELEIGKVKIVGNEVKMSCDFALSDRTVKLYGVIDRLQINSLEDGSRLPVVTDYKTGWVSDDGLKVALTAMEQVVNDTGHKHLLQLLFYALLLRHSSSENLSYIKEYPGIQCGIMCIKDANKNIMFPEYWHPAIVETENGATDCLAWDIVDVFGDTLRELLSEILNPSKAFKQTEDGNHCSYCDYRHICRKG